MKKLAYILLILLWVSCKNEYRAPVLNNESYDEVVAEENELIQFSAINNYETLSIEKLTEYFDLLKLQTEHPEFGNDIEEQLAQYTSESLFEFTPQENFKVKNVDQVGEIEKVSDTIFRIQLEVKIATSKLEIVDSIDAQIISKRIMLDGKTMISNKVTFSKD